MIKRYSSCPQRAHSLNRETIHAVKIPIKSLQQYRFIKGPLGVPGNQGLIWQGKIPWGIKLLSWGLMEEGKFYQAVVVRWGGMG
jgi:hypothetical protein